MGRYYNGDIEGKFWFAVQSSTDASFFGADPYEPNYVNYYFEKDEHLEMVKNAQQEGDTRYKTLARHDADRGILWVNAKVEKCKK